MVSMVIPACWVRERLPIALVVTDPDSLMRCLKGQGGNLWGDRVGGRKRE